MRYKYNLSDNSRRIAKEVCGAIKTNSNTSGPDGRINRSRRRRDLVFTYRYR